jgi:hypothetical protein
MITEPHVTCFQSGEQVAVQRTRSSPRLTTGTLVSLEMVTLHKEYLSDQIGVAILSNLCVPIILESQIEMIAVRVRFSVGRYGVRFGLERYVRSFTQNGSS